MILVCKFSNQSKMDGSLRYSHQSKQYKTDRSTMYPTIFSSLNRIFIKFRFSKKAKIFETISHMIFRLLSKCKIKWEIVSNFCGPFKMSKLYPCNFAIHFRFFYLIGDYLTSVAFLVLLLEELGIHLFSVRKV